VNIDTVRFSHILEAESLYDLNYFFAHTAFVIAHKSERIETLLSVIWYLPVNSPVLVVTNCSEIEKEALKQGLARHLTDSRQIYLIHQKDERIARFFAEHGVDTILGPDGKVVDGKGEGMYIGALIASLLKSPQWMVFYDADNFVPNALLEYTLAMSKLYKHIKRMIADSLGAFLSFEQWLAPDTKRQLWSIYRELDLEMSRPVVYPALQELSLEAKNIDVDDYRLLEEYPMSVEQETLCG
jgi:mannosyl-3-phosphoglycerate synthase